MKVAIKPAFRLGPNDTIISNIFNYHIVPICYIQPIEK